jgi:hypothetical protein
VRGPTVPPPAVRPPVADLFAVNWFAASRPAVTGICRTAAAVAAVGTGIAAAWLSAGSTGVLAGMAVLLAAGNGYAKAYSP